MEWVWRPSAESLGTDLQIFTHALFDHYRSPAGFDFDVMDDDARWVNNENSPEFNADQEADRLMALMDERAKHYLTDEVFVTFGDDFRYMSAF